MWSRHQKFVRAIIMVVTLCPAYGSDTDMRQEQAYPVRSKRLYHDRIDCMTKRIKVEPEFKPSCHALIDRQQMAVTLTRLHIPIVFPVCKDVAASSINFATIKIEPQDDDTCHAPVLNRSRSTNQWSATIKTVYHRKNTAMAIDLNHSGCIMNRLGQHKKALIYYEQALTFSLLTNKVNAMLLYNRGITKAKIDCIDDAIQDLRQSLKIKHAFTPSQRVQVYKKLNELYLRKNWPREINAKN